MANFIGQAALTHIAEVYAKEVVMGAAYYRPSELDRLGIAVISGVQFKHTKNILNRKGHTTKRKVVGQTLNSNIGYIEEREMVTYLAWNHYEDNEDSYREDAVFDTEGSAAAHYPASELAVQAILANYAEDLFDNIMWGDVAAHDNDGTGLDLYDGFMTYLAGDIERGRISVALGNLVTVPAIASPVNGSDVSAWNVFKNWQLKWHPNLQNAEKVLIWLTPKTAMDIAGAYGNAHNNFQQVIWMENGNFRVPEYNNVEFAPASILGTGDRMIATVPMNAEYGVDSDNSKTYVSVRFGSDKDHKDISFQIQSIQGTRFLNVNPGKFSMTTGSLTAAAGFAGDYTKDAFNFASNDTNLGTVVAKVGGSPITSGDEVAANTTVELTATPAEGKTFVRWNNGATDKVINIVAKGQPEYIVALFK